MVVLAIALDVAASLICVVSAEVAAATADTLDANGLGTDRFGVAVAIDATEPASRI